jgi:hypothetical protein
VAPAKPDMLIYLFLSAKASKPLSGESRIQKFTNSLVWTDGEGCDAILAYFASGRRSYK